jgi:hypothetical protein
MLKKQLETTVHSNSQLDNSQQQNEVQVFENLKQKVDVLVEENQRLNAMLMQVHNQNNVQVNHSNHSNPHSGHYNGQQKPKLTLQSSAQKYTQQEVNYAHQ